MKAVCFGSSSSGNCFLIELDGANPFFVECGIEWRKVLTRALNDNVDVYNAEVCLITHSHGDHCKAHREASLNGLKLYGSRETLEAIGEQGYELKANAPSKVADGLYVLPFSVKHDAPGSMGFYIKTAKESIAFVNDNKGMHANVSMLKPDYIFVECNYYDKQAKAILDDAKRYLQRAEISTEYSKAQNAALVLERNLKYHSSLLDCAENIAKFDLSKCKGIFLMHLSNRYANEFEMKKLIAERFKKPVFVCTATGSIK